MDTSPAIFQRAVEVSFELRVILRVYSGAARSVSVANFSIVSDRIAAAWETLLKLMELALLPIAPANGMAGRAALGDQAAIAEPFLSLACDYAEAVLPYLTAEQALPFYMAVREILRMYATAASSETFVQQGRVAEDGDE